MRAKRSPRVFATQQGWKCTLSLREENRKNQRIKSLWDNTLQGKSFLIAVFCVVRCILYPGTVICIASKTRKQAEEILEKIQNDLMVKAKTPYLRQEIKEIVIGQRDSYAEFYNTSRIFVATANENSRHFRANLLVNTCACWWKRQQWIGENRWRLSGFIC